MSSQSSPRWPKPARETSNGASGVPHSSIDPARIAGWMSATRSLAIRTPASPAGRRRPTNPFPRSAE